MGDDMTYAKIRKLDTETLVRICEASRTEAETTRNFMVKCAAQSRVNAISRELYRRQQQTI